MRGSENKVLAFFDVLSWGYGAYVNLVVNSPTGRELKKFEAESEGRVEFVATEDGEHSFCFSNAYTETEVSFWINTETDSALADVAKEGMFGHIAYIHLQLRALAHSVLDLICFLTFCRCDLYSAGVVYLLLSPSF